MHGQTEVFMASTASSASLQSTRPSPGPAPGVTYVLLQAQRCMPGMQGEAKNHGSTVAEHTVCALYGSARQSDPVHSSRSDMDQQSAADPEASDSSKSKRSIPVLFVLSYSLALTHPLTSSSRD